MRLTTAEIEDAAKQLEGKSAQDVLTWAIGRFGGAIAVASSFSLEDCVVIDLAHAVDPNVRIFALDTGRLPEETYLTADRIRDKYRRGTADTQPVIEWLFPDRARVEALERAKGLYSFMESLDNRHECCGIRKVEPLSRVLSGLDAWVTGLRREQSVTRTTVREVEADASNGGIMKINPLVGWSWAQVESYAQERRVPVHPLHKKGYPSIGCAPCTRAIEPGEHPRAGRWWWENPESKECGLHQR